MKYLAPEFVCIPIVDGIEFALNAATEPTTLAEALQRPDGDMYHKEKGRSAHVGSSKLNESGKVSIIPKHLPPLLVLGPSVL